jgi:hypothetical protein
VAANRFQYEIETQLPPLAWLATVDRGVVRVRCGTSVRRSEDGFLEGTWVGDAMLAGLPASTTIFGSGMMADGADVVVVPPSHPHERLYFHRSVPDEARWMVSNSMAWLLAAADLELDPAVPYPTLFTAASEYVRPPTAEIPTLTTPIIAAVYDNFRLTPDGVLTEEKRPTEQPFADYADYSTRIRAALTSAIANAPGYEPAVALSSGYDSTAVAAIAAPLGCRRALTFALGTSGPDSGAVTAERLGMSAETFDRLAYLSRADLPEAEFLATGMSGEDVVLSSMAESLRRTFLITGSEEFLLKGSTFRPELHRGDLSWCSVTEFRLRLDFVHVPLLFMGATEQPSLTRIIESAEMDPYRLSGKYDKPIQRRLAEEAGVPRGSFATVKRRASGAIHVDGLAAMATASVSSVRAYAAAHGEGVPRQRGRPPRRLVRAAGRLAKRLGLTRIANRLNARRRSWIHLEPRLGTLLLRWSIDVIAPRYTGQAGSEPYDRRG